MTASSSNRTRIILNQKMKNHSSEDIAEQECASVISEKKEDIERKSTMKHVKI